VTSPLLHLFATTTATVLALGLLGCSQTQSAAGPVAGSETVSSSTSVMSSKAASPWNQPASTPSPESVASLTEPINAAMMFCSRTLNLTPCGLVTSGMDDVMVCLSGCQTQIETVVQLTVERAALDCASSPQPEGGARECALNFPEGAAIDAEAIGKQCAARCEQLAALGPGAPRASGL
jgi:hypothetical protein